MKSIQDLIKESHQSVLRLDDKVELEDEVSIADVLTEVLSKSTECQPYALCLSYQKMGLNDLKALVNFVQNTPTLIYLDLSNGELDFKTNVYFEGFFIDLLEAIKRHPGLRAVDFSDTNLSPNSLYQMANMIRENKTLLQLFVAGNTAGLKTSVWLNFGKLLSESLQENATLIAFSTLFTPLEENGGKEMREARKSINDKLAANRRSFSSRILANPEHLDQFIIPDPMLEFLNTLEFSGEKIDAITLEVNPLRYIKEKQNEQLSRPNMPALQTQQTRAQGLTAGQEDSKKRRFFSNV